jgi:hypothetical protein
LLSTESISFPTEQILWPEHISVNIHDIFLNEGVYKSSNLIDIMVNWLYDEYTYLLASYYFFYKKCYVHVYMLTISEIINKYRCYVWHPRMVFMTLKSPFLSVLSHVDPSWL